MTATILGTGPSFHDWLDLRYMFGRPPNDSNENIWGLNAVGEHFVPEYLCAIENYTQHEKTGRLPHILNTPAKVLFVSDPKMKAAAIADKIIVVQFGSKVSDDKIKHCWEVNKNGAQLVVPRFINQFLYATFLAYGYGYTDFHYVGVDLHSHLKIQAQLPRIMEQFEMLRSVMSECTFTVSSETSELAKIIPAA